MKIKGKVIKGDGIAMKDFAIPTANLAVDSIDLEPGVYAAKIRYDDSLYEGVVCYRTGDSAKFEVHIFALNKNLYGKTLAVEIQTKVSELVPWVSAEQMKKKIDHDIELAKDYFHQKNTR